MVNLAAMAETYDNAGPPNQDGMNDGDGKEGRSVSRCQYTIPGVLHFVQHEWAKFEMQRAQWEMEKADLQAQVAFLKGERKGQENLKNDLVRRIKMLEYALKQERAKNYKLKHGTEPDPAEIQAEALPDEGIVEDGAAYQPHSAHSWQHGRQLLRQYLEEIGYSEKMLELRLTRAQSLLGVANTNNKSGESVSRHAEVMLERAFRERDAAVSATAQFLAKEGEGGARRGSDSEDEDEDPKAVLDRIQQLKEGSASSATKEEDQLGPEEVDALEEFSFLDQRPAAAPSPAAAAKKADGEWDSVDYARLDQMKAEYKQLLVTSRSKRERESKDAEEEGLPELGDLSGLDPSNTDDVDPGAADATGDTDAERRTWTCRHTLRSHFDGIRAMVFHPVEPLLLTASYDATLKLWNLGRGAPGSPSTGKKGSSSGTDLEPVYTFRGHDGPVLCLCLSPTGDTVYTGGRDGTIRSWTLPSPNIEPYEPYDRSICGEVLEGHTDAVWSVAYHSGTDNRLISASADGSIRVWEPSSPEALLSTIDPPAGKDSGDTPVSLDFVSTEPKQALVAYSIAASPDKSRAYLLDLESGKALLTFDLSNSTGRVYQIISHPTMPMTITASADSRIRFYDNGTGTCTESTVAHLDAVTSLSVDPNGLFLLSGSHDGSLRLWNLETKSCLQEITAHRKKLDEAVLAVAFHPSRPMIASAGADSNAKVFV